MLAKLKLITFNTKELGVYHCELFLNIKILTNKLWIHTHFPNALLFSYFYLKFMIEIVFYSYLFYVVLRGEYVLKLKTKHKNYILNTFN